MKCFIVAFLYSVGDNVTLFRLNVAFQRVNVLG